MAWSGQGVGGQGGPQGRKTGPGSPGLRLFWSHFWLFWHHFGVFFRSCFSTWFGDSFFMILVLFLTSFWHHFKIIFVSVLVSLENVISDTPTKEINGFAFWNVFRNMIKLRPKPNLKTESKNKHQNDEKRLAKGGQK